ncbi:MAG: hypothetical protein ABEI77_07625 [Halorientalis sp.]
MSEKRSAGHRYECTDCEETFGDPGNAMGHKDETGHETRMRDPSEMIEQPVTEPLDGYERETTEDYRRADAGVEAGDGIYLTDEDLDPLTDEIARVVTRAGGRIPLDFGADTHNDGGARMRTWTVYAPAPNPYHVAAAVTDLLLDADHVDGQDVRVVSETAADLESELRSDSFGYRFENDEQDLVEKLLREFRWASGLSDEQRKELNENPSEARTILRERDGDDFVMEDNTDALIERIGPHPGDAWDYHKVYVEAHETAEEEYHG